MQTNYHMSVLVHEQAKKYGDREMLIYQDFSGKEWKSLSWNQVSQTVKQISNALLNLGVKVQENIGIFSQNSVQYIECDFAAWGIRAVTIPFYATSSEQQIQFMVNDAKVRFLFVGEQDQYDKARRIFSLSSWVRICPDRLRWNGCRRKLPSMISPIFSIPVVQQVIRKVLF